MGDLLRRLDRALVRFGSRVTSAVGTMWCALAFTILALVSLPAALHSHDVVVIVGWIAQTFLQLVLLSVIMVGQSIESARTEQRDQETHDAVMAEHAETRQILADLHTLVSEMHPVVTGGAS